MNTKTNIKSTKTPKALQIVGTSTDATKTKTVVSAKTIRARNLNLIGLVSW